MPSLLAPLSLLWLGLLAPLVLLYILKIRRQRRKVSSTWLWASARRDLLAKSPFQKLVPQIPLLLQALAIALLALALARPASRAEDGAGDHLAIVVDTSASMSALADPAAPDAGSRLDAARRVARGLVETLPPGSDAMIVEAGRSARVASPLERDRRRLFAAIERLEPADVEGDLAESIAIGVDRLLQTTGERRVVVVTDGNLARPGALAGAALPIEVVTVGAPIDNAAIVRVDVRGSADPKTGREVVQVFALLANFGRAPRELYVTLRQHNASDVLASRRVLLAPGERAPVVLDFEATPGDARKGLVVDASPHDAMPVDDVAFGRVPPADAMPVVIAAADGDAPSPWLERVFSSDPRAEVKRVSLTQLVQSTGIDPSALVVVDGVCPPAVPGGDLVIVAPPPGPCWGAKVGAPIERPVVTSWDTADPRMRFLVLDGVAIQAATLLTPEGASRELVRAQEGTLVADVSTPARTATLLGFDVGDTDWPLKASFVLFARNLLDLARAHRERGVSGPQRAGEPLRVDVPVGAAELAVTAPDGAPREASLQAGLAVVPDVRRAGLYEISWQGAQPGSLFVPVNLTSELESDVREVVEPPASGAVTVRPSSSRAEGHREWAWLLALLVVALVVADVAWATRRPRTAAAPGAPTPPERAVPRRAATPPAR